MKSGKIYFPVASGNKKNALAWSWKMPSSFSDKVPWKVLHRKMTSNCYKILYLFPIQTIYSLILPFLLFPCWSWWYILSLKNYPKHFFFSSNMFHSQTHFLFSFSSNIILCASWEPYGDQYRYICVFFGVWIWKQHHHRHHPFPVWSFFPLATRVM